MNRKKRTIGSLLIVAVILSTTASAQDAERVSPFEYIRWKDVAPEVLVHGAWYHILSINGVQLDEILQQCKLLHNEEWRRAFDVDLISVMTEMDQPPGPVVTLELRDLKTGANHTLTDVKLTAENYEAILRAKYGDRDESTWILGTPGIKRDHRDAPHPAFERLAERIESTRKWALETISAEDAAEDLDDLEWHLVNRFAYLNRVRVDYQAALDTLRLGLGDSISRGAFATQLVRFMALLGDGNSRLNRYVDTIANRGIPWIAFMPKGFAPFMVADAGDRWVAYSGPHQRLLDRDHPYLRGLDGVPIGQWMTATRGIIARGSPQFVRRMSATYAMLAGYVRASLKLPDEQMIWIDLESEDGTESRRLAMPISDSPSMPPRKSPIAFEKLDGNVGYLRITEMKSDARYLDTLFEAMTELRKTKGLILDMRDNKGGTRDPIRELFPFFMADNEPPFVANVAAARILPETQADRPEGFLGDAYLFPLTSKFWNPAERSAIERFRAGFKPEWRLPRTGFSPLHYFVLAPRHSKVYYHYDRPVIVLMNATCFSSTEVLLGALKGRRGVTLMGEPSGGGSGWAKNFATLTNSGFRVQLSAMASFRPNGALYDGKGIEPDVVVKPTLDDLVGKTDSLKDTAATRLRN